MAIHRKKKKSSDTPSGKFSMNHFLKNQLRKLPIDCCYLMNGWETTGIASVIIIRKHINGKYSAAVFYVSLLGEGVADTFFLFNQPKSEIDELITEDEVECTYAIAHNIIWGAVDYADELGLKPHKNFIETQYFLEEDTDEIEFIEIEFGKAGRPVVIIDNENKKHDVIRTLDNKIGRENYDIIDSDELEDESDDLPFEYEKLGFDSLEDMMECLLENNSEAEIKEYFEFFVDITNGKNDLNLKGLVQKCQEKTFLRIIETLYYIFKNGEDAEFQPLFAQLFFGHDNESPFDIDDKKITYKPIELGYNKSKEEKENYIKLLEGFNSGKKDIDQFVNKAIKLYPNNPIFKGLLYRYLFDKDKIKEIKKNIEKDYNQSPDYLFFKLYYGEILLKDELYDKIDEIFCYKTKLEELYPQREIFHITEYVSFCLFFIKFNLALDKIETAVQYYDALSKYYVEGNEKLMAFAVQLILQSKLKFVMKK